MAHPSSPPRYSSLPPDRLRWRCDPAALPFETTGEIEPLDEILGQDRAIEAIRLGLEIEGDGYNIFVAGFVGTGRNTTMQRFLERAQAAAAPPPDLVYVHNFDDPDRPLLLRFPPGRAVAFRASLRETVEALRREAPRLLEAETHLHRRQKAAGRWIAKEKDIVTKFEQRLARDEFALVQVQAGLVAVPDVVPLIEGQPASPDQLEAALAAKKLDRSQVERIRRRREEFVGELRDAMKKVRDLARSRDEELRALDRQTFAPLVRERVDTIAAAHAPPPAGERAAAVATPTDPAAPPPPGDGLREWLARVEHDIVAHMEDFGGQPAGLPAELGDSLAPDAPFHLYDVNIIVDNGRTRGAPVINENFPTFRNLFGFIERQTDASGAPVRTDHRSIKAGSLLRANGGHLVLNALDVLQEAGVWPMLKRVLRSRTLEIQSFDTWFLQTTSTVKPQPIDVKLKVILIGGHDVWRLLHDADFDFRKIFKVKADFDTEMPNDEAGRTSYARFIRRILAEEALPPFDRTAVALAMEEGARSAGRTDRLSTRFNDAADLVRESCYWARREGRPVVSAVDVARAVRERRRRVSLGEEKVQEMIDRGVILLDVEGSCVGQVNGLSVYSASDHAFGRPSRITASVGMGRRGIVNIERESRLSGPTHDKGLLILGGLLRERFARDKPLTLTASLCFEQSYGGVEGDSASCAEACALLSALAGVPLRQDLAITGSINQKGEIQPIGGVTLKVEGFYDTCAPRGLTGRQGVILPALNASELMLRDDVVEAAASGRFHVYAIERLEEAAELLSGISAGTPDAEGYYPPETFFGRVNARLRELAESVTRFGSADASTTSD